MAKRVFFWSKLCDGVDPAEYDRWVREVAYPFVARSFPTITSYAVTRLEGMLEGEDPAPYDVVEVVETDDFDAYLAELSPDKPEVREFDRQWQSYLCETVAAYGEVIE